jgi:hypothetical protein
MLLWLAEMHVGLQRPETSEAGGFLAKNIRDQEYKTRIS